MISTIAIFFKWDSESVFLETLGLKPDVKTITSSIALIFLEYVISWHGPLKSYGVEGEAVTEIKGDSFGIGMQVPKYGKEEEER